MNVHEEGYRWAEPGQLEHATCKTRGTACVIDRNVHGPTSWAASIGGLARTHDHVRCPRSGSAWHNRAVALRREIAAASSHTLVAVLQSDYQQVVRQHLPERV